jgi:hypothetical protein
VDGTDPLDAVYTDGNVGIGTNNPSAKLEVIQTGVTKDSWVLSQPNKAIGIQGDNGAYFAGRDVTNNIEFAMGTSVLGRSFAGSTSNHAFDLRTNAIPRLLINTVGDVGIGTNNPSEKLHIDGGGLFIDNSPDEATIKYSSSNIGVAKRIIMQPDGGTGQIDVRPGTGSSNIPAIVLQTSPTGANNTESFLFGRGSYSLADNVFHLASSVNGIVNADSFPIAFSVSNTTDGRFEALRVANSGNIGIGTTTPSEKLEVNGKIKATDINFTGLPTSPVGLSTGDVWNDNNILTIVP